MKVKICGITDINDALYIAEHNAWAIGFIFYKKSPRYIEPLAVKKIINEVPKHIEKFGVFVNSSADEIINNVDTTGITTIQLHGDESPEICNQLISKQLPAKIIKAFRPKNIDDVEKIKDYHSVSRFLVDANVANEYGGTGHKADWNLAIKAKEYGEIILAGGINSQNINQAIKHVQPFAIDLSSSVEIEPGKKCHKKIKEIFEIIGESNEGYK